MENRKRKNKRIRPSSPFGGGLRRTVLISQLFFLLILSSCWPAKMGFVDDSMPAEWQNFYVTPLELNAATAPANYNAALTESVRTGIQNNTKLEMLTEADSADVRISGTVNSYYTSPQAITEGDNAQRNRLTVSVSFTILSPTKGIEKMQMTSTRFADYDATQQLSDVEAQLLEVINQQIVQDVINKLRSNW